VPADAVAAAYLAACREEIEAPKPGNVHVFAPGHRMAVEDFRASADVSAGPLCRPGSSVGERIFAAVAATRAAVGQNTNLGIVLLCAPLAAAAEREEALRPALGRILEGLTVTDAAQAFRAITLAGPGGLGAAPEHDVHEPPVVGLRDAMAAAAERDRIARAYATGFSDIFDLGLPALARAQVAQNAPWWPATAVYLAFLAEFPDTHIARKHGQAVAEAIRRETREFLGTLGGEPPLLSRLLAFDAALKARGLNPGTSADLTVATLFAAKLDLILRETPDNG
jgi:triphosphoribosyl-dephospho-CoA synthase